MEDLIIHGKFVLFRRITEGSIIVRDGKITSIQKGEVRGDRKINLKPGQVLLPGLIDVHVHLRDFLQKEKESIESGTKAAIHGGITTVFDMPNTNPPVIDSETFKRREELLRKKAYSNYAIGFLLAGSCDEAKKTPADFYKTFMGASTGGMFSKNFEEDYRCSPRVLSVHAEDQGVISQNPERPKKAEILAVKRAIKAAETLRKPLNICHVSTAEAVREIISRGLPWVSFEVTPHHLFLTKRDYQKNPLLKVYPPLRSEKDRRTLWKNLSRIPIIASDHAPHTLEDKENGAAGIPGLETEVGLLLDAVNRGMIDLVDIVEKMHTNPVRVFGIKGKGLQVGADADFTIVDMRREWKVRAEEFYTGAKWSPWDGKKLKGKVIMMILSGEVVMEDDEVLGKPKGERINV